jgi:exonuclease SbcC
VNSSNALAYLAHGDQTQQDQAQLQATLARLEQQLTDTTTVETQIQSLQRQLEELGRPREKSQILQRTLPDPSQLEATQTQLLADQVALQQQLASLDQQLATFGDLETALETEQTRRRQCQTGYHLYLQVKPWPTSIPRSRDSTRWPRPPWSDRTALAGGG